MGYARLRNGAFALTSTEAAVEGPPDSHDGDDDTDGCGGYITGLAERPTESEVASDGNKRQESTDDPEHIGFRVACSRHLRPVGPGTVKSACTVTSSETLGSSYRLC
jgi:hypothetical protein